MFTLMRFSGGSGAVFQFALRQADPFRMFLSLTRVTMPLFLLAMWFYAMYKIALYEKEDSKDYLVESIPSIVFGIISTMLPRWGWALIPIVATLYVYFIIQVRKFRKTKTLSLTLRKIFYIRVWIFSQRYVLAFVFALLFIAIPPNGSWMKSEIITTKSHKSIRAFVEEGNFGVTYLDIHSHRLGYISEENILLRHPCTVLKNVQPWLSSEDLISVTPC